MKKKKKLDYKKEERADLEKIAKDFHFWIPRSDNFPKSKYWFSTGSTLLDLAVHRDGGGIPSGRIVEISGAESTGKTVLGAAIGGSCQRQQGIVVLFDVESTFDYERGKIYGLDPERVLLPEDQPATIEELFQSIKKVLTEVKAESFCFIIDSIAALETIEELEASYSDSSYGTERAKKLSRVLRSMPRLLAEKQSTLVFINQIRDKLGVQFGRKDDTPGGRAIKFYASCRIRLNMIQKIKDKSKTVIGIDVESEVIKNKIDRPFLIAKFPIYFADKHGGIDDLESCVSFIRENSDVLGRKGEWFSFKEYKEQSLVKFLNVLEERKADKEIYSIVKRVWDNVYNCDREGR